MPMSIGSVGLLKVWWDADVVLKRLIDVAGALAGLLLLSPFILGTATAVWFSMGRPLLFRQQRPGLNGRPFDMVKFRTMADRRDAQGAMLKDEFRLTRVGRFLRASSLDELPGLWSVLKGDMSLVGPRPLLMRYLPRYTPAQMRRHEVKPGITGWAQVNGRNAISWEDKFALDVWYVDHCSLLLDIKILWLTVLRVVKRQDVNVDAVGTMPEFFGSDDRDRPGGL
jgi:lipopolysaccharide/colanic/teichoic acid biosynthesis glycosyltransferase